MNEIFRNKMFFSTVNPLNKEILIAHMEPPKHIIYYEYRPILFTHINTTV